MNIQFVVSFNKSRMKANVLRQCCQVVSFFICLTPNERGIEHGILIFVSQANRLSVVCALDVTNAADMRSIMRSVWHGFTSTTVLCLAPQGPTIPSITSGNRPISYYLRWLDPLDGTLSCFQNVLIAGKRNCFNVKAEFANFSLRVRNEHRSSRNHIHFFEHYRRHKSGDIMSGYQKCV